jgi:bifunctional polynucleotide phosphatase/kinase
MKWKIKNDAYIYGKTDYYKCKNNIDVRLALFDLDSTLITTKSGNVFPKYYDDLKLLFKNTQKSLENISSLTSNYQIIIISNQGGIKNSDIKLEKMKKRIEYLEELLENIPFQIYIANHDNVYRKPYPTFYNIIKNYYQKKSCLIKNSFYCGDACGRPTDFSSSDYFFYLNTDDIKIFYTPEEYFLDKVNNFDHNKLIKKYKKYYFTKNKNKYKFEKQDKLEYIIMIGLPASGKSYYSELLKEKFNCEIISQDNLKTYSACKKKIHDCIDNEKSIIIDNTNLTYDIRKKYIGLLKNNRDDYHIRFIYFDLDIKHIIYNNRHRYYFNSGKNKIPDYVLKSMHNKMDKPNNTEDYDILNIINHNYTKKIYLFLNDL